MKLSFVGAAAIRREPADWGVVGWLCKPAITGASKLAIVEATFSVGRGHAFHMHPLQEEVIYVLEGEIEQWVGEERRILGRGDSAFIPAGVAHASFCVGDREAKILAIFGPSVPEGSQTVEVADQEPWKSLRP